MNDEQALFSLLQLKRNKKIVYTHNNLSNWPPYTGSHNLKVISKPKRLGAYWLVKCKVLGKNNWYKQIYITALDFRDGRIKEN